MRWTSGNREGNKRLLHKKRASRSNSGEHDPTRPLCAIILPVPITPPRPGPNICPISVEMSARNWPQSARNGPNSSHAWQTMSQLRGRHLPSLAEVFSNVGCDRPGVGPKFGRNCPSLANVHPILIEIGPIGLDRPKSGRNLPKFGRCPAEVWWNSAQTWSTSVQI